MDMAEAKPTETRGVQQDGSVEKWSSWLIKDEKDLDGVSSGLRVEIERMGKRPSAMENATCLTDAYMRIEDLLRAGHTTDEEAAPWLIAISGRMQTLSEGAAKRLDIEAQTDAVAPILDAKELAREMAREQGLMTPQEYVEMYRRAEENYVPFEIMPGQEPRFWPILNNKERDQWIIRSTLAKAYSKKMNAISTEDLYMDKMKEFAVDLDKVALKELFGKGSMDGALPAAGIYSEIIGSPRFYKYGDKKYFETNKLEEPNLKNIFCKVMENEHIKNELVRDYGEEIVRRLEGMEAKLRESCPDSIYTVKQEAFPKLRESIRYWLTTKGRNLLLTEAEMENRDEFFQDKEKAFLVLQTRARDAEHVGWEFTFVTSQLEHFDSREYRPAGTKRHKPSNFWTLFQWMVMHPQERFEAKIIRQQNGVIEAKEEWAALGTWAVRNATSGSWTVSLPNGKRAVRFPRILPDVIMRDALHPQRFKDGRGEDSCLFAKFTEVGRKVLFEERLPHRSELEGVIDWNKVDEAPFVPFNYDEMRWADVILSVFKKGAGSKINFGDIGEAARNLRLSRDAREKLVIAYYGANPNSVELKPMYDPIAWNAKQYGLKRDYPNFFLER